MRTKAKNIYENYQEYAQNDTTKDTKKKLKKERKLVFSQVDFFYKKKQKEGLVDFLFINSTLDFSLANASL